MATVSQPGSRGSMITALVIFVILFLVAAVFAVMKHSDYESLKQSTDKDLKKYKDAISDTELMDMSKLLNDFRRDSGLNGGTAYASLKKMNDDMAKKIAGKTSPKDAMDSARNTVKSAADSTGVAIPQEPLVDTIATLADAIKRNNDRMGSLNKDLASARKDLDTQISQVNEVNKLLVSTQEKAGERRSEMEKELELYREDVNGKYTEVKKSWNDSTSNSSKTIDELNDKVMNLTLELQQVMNDNEKLIGILKYYKPNDGANATIRQPDGKIIRIADKNVVYINLGQGDHLCQGMTFQIYDRSEGLPKLNDEMNDLPPGKASLEVVRVSAGSSECRVMDLQEGQVVQEGDMIANIVYDKNVKTKFHVYGDFDIDHNDVASEQEAEIVRRLIGQWGGQLVDKIDIDLDYVVLGKQPEIPNFTKEQIENDPIIRFTYETAKKKMDDYDNIRNKALDLQVPVLNHNRFLYMMGYWGQGGR